jgi:hypothetical protein
MKKQDKFEELFEALHEKHNHSRSYRKKTKKIGKAEEGSLIKQKDITKDMIYILDIFLNKRKLIP